MWRWRGRTKILAAKGSRAAKRSRASKRSRAAERRRAPPSAAERGRSQTSKLGVARRARRRSALDSRRHSARSASLGALGSVDARRRSARSVSLDARRRSTLGVARRSALLGAWRRSALGVARGAWHSSRRSALRYTRVLIVESWVPRQSKAPPATGSYMCWTLPLTVNRPLSLDQWV